MKTSQQLAELRFRLQSQQLFLTHLELRFNKLLGLLEPLLPFLAAQQQQMQRAEALEADYLVLLEGTQQEWELTRQELNITRIALEEAEREVEALALEQERTTALYEQELEQWIERQLTRDQTRHDTRDIGRSLARITSERNALNYEFKALSAAFESLKADYQEQSEALAYTTEALESATAKSTPAEDMMGHDFLKRLTYQVACETARVLHVPLNQTQKHRLAEGLDLTPTERESLEKVPVSVIQQHLQTQVRPQPAVTSPPTSEDNAVDAPVTLSAGVYTLGDELHPAERPVHTVNLNAFQMARCPVTNAQYAEFMAAGGYKEARWWTPEGYEHCQQARWQHPAFWNEKTYHSGLDFPDYPVVGVSWYEADAYARWYSQQVEGARLPEESEWEAAARGLEQRIWPWGNEWRANYANTAETGPLKTTPVGLYPRGATPEGLLDLVGNVFEWTASIYAPYPYTGTSEVQPEAGHDRTLRGCSFHHKGGYFSRAAYRFHSPPVTRHSDMGFRLAFTPV